MKKKKEIKIMNDEILKNEIERVFSYCEKDISVQMKISRYQEKYN